MNNVNNIKPFISVITIVFNDVNNIENTILSVLNQTYCNFEYLIIDGGSFDGTLEIIQKYNSKLSYFVSEKDNGISDAFNKGILKSKGSLIGLLNSGDYYEKNSVELAANIFNDLDFNDHVVIHGNIKMFDHSYSKIYKPFPISTFYRQMPIWHPTIFVSIDLYKNYKYDLKYKIAMDYDVFSRIFHNKKTKFIHINEVITNMNIKGISNESALIGFKEVMIASRINLKVGYVNSYLIYLCRCIFYKLIKVFK